MIQGLTGQVNQLRAEINVVNQQMNRLPRYRGRLANNYAQEANAELVIYRNQLNNTLTQQNLLLGQARSQPADPKLKQKIDDEVQARYDEYLQAVHDLTQLVTTTKEKYAALAKNDEVTKALAGLDPAIKPRPQLGPSHGFHENVKLAERFEKEVAQSPTEPKTKAAAKSKRGPNSSQTAPDSWRRRHDAFPPEHSPLTPAGGSRIVSHCPHSHHGPRMRRRSGFAWFDQFTTLIGWPARKADTLATVASMWSPRCRGGPGDVAE